MKVDVRRIAESKGASLQASGTVVLPGELSPGFSSADPARVEAIVTNAGRFFHVEGTMALRLHAQCVRCLEPCAIELKVPFDQDYLQRGKSSEESEPEKEFLLLDGNILDLVPAVNEAALMAWPMKPLCREDCPGICPQCGKNLKEGGCTCVLEAGHSNLADLARLLSEKEV